MLFCLPLSEYWGTVPSSPAIAALVLGPQFGESVYISEVKGARKIKSDVQVAMNKNSDPVTILN